MNEQKNNPTAGTSGREINEAETSPQILFKRKLELVLTILSDFVGLELSQLEAFLVQGVYVLTPSVRSLIGSHAELAQHLNHPNQMMLGSMHPIRLTLNHVLDPVILRIFVSLKTVV